LLPIFKSRRGCEKRSRGERKTHVASNPNVTLTSRQSSPNSLDLADLVLRSEDDTMLEQESGEAVAELDVRESGIELVNFVGAVDGLP
jgi:hypothetical protein